MSITLYQALIWTTDYWTTSIFISSCLVFLPLQSVTSSLPVSSLKKKEWSYQSYVHTKTLYCCSWFIQPPNHYCDVKVLCDLLYVNISKGPLPVSHIHLTYQKWKQLAAPPIPYALPHSIIPYHSANALFDNKTAPSWPDEGQANDWGMNGHKSIGSPARNWQHYSQTVTVGMAGPLKNTLIYFLKIRS